MIMHCSRDWSCTDHVTDHASITWLIMHWSRNWSCTYLKWASCKQHMDYFFKYHFKILFDWIIKLFTFYLIIDMCIQIYHCLFFLFVSSGSSFPALFKSYLTNFYLFIHFWSCQVPCRILVPNQGLNLAPTLKVPCPNHWAAGEFPYLTNF